VFTVAKVWGVVDWSWWLVLSPSLIGIGLVILLVVVRALASLDK
jgi:hypothetical protein